MGISMKTTSGKILASVALVGTAAAVAGMGTYGAFTSTTNASQTVKAGNVEVGIGAANNTMTTAIEGMLPGDSVTKFVTLENMGDANLGSVTLATAVALPATGNPSPLTSDTVNGLQISIEFCSEAWTGTAGSYNCGGSKGAPVTNVPIIGSRDLGNVNSKTAKKSDFLKITTTLPKDAPNTFKGATSTVSFTFTATQRTATSN